MSDEQQLLSFIRATFLSVWALEVLCFLSKRREQAHSTEELIAELRASESVIGKSVEQLEAGALVVVDDAGAVRFAPPTRDLEFIALDAISLYERRPDQVRRTIVMRPSTGLAAFSDAFKLRKD